MASLWQEILRVDRVGIHDDFFALGGHSLLAMQVVARLRHELGVNISLGSLFENSCIERLAVEVLGSLLAKEQIEMNSNDGALATTAPCRSTGREQPASAPRFQSVCEP